MKQEEVFIECKIFSWFWREMSQDSGYDLIGRKARGSFGMELQDRQEAEEG